MLSLFNSPFFSIFGHKGDKAKNSVAHTATPNLTARVSYNSASVAS